jgi:spore photoproduct lyase
LKNSGENYYNPVFSHVYVEKKVRSHTRTVEILAKLPHAQVVEIDHYKDVFCRSGQDSIRQHKAQSLIIAAKEGELLYEGAPVCQSFGNPYFYYTSCIMNCVYDCEYCYLKGMYASANMVVFINLEDIFAELEKLLARHPVYLCVSYDTDLMAVDYLTGYVPEWIHFAKLHKDLKLELRTKSANINLLEKLDANPNVIFAFTLSPQAVIEACEHGTPPLHSRIACAKKAVEMGFCVRLCFDPMLYCPDWKSQYESMLEEIFQTLDFDAIVDVSVGSFRVSQDYLKKMRRQEPYSSVVQFPYENDGGVYHYPTELMNTMEAFLVGKIVQKLPQEKIFRWKNE